MLLALLKGLAQRLARPKHGQMVAAITLQPGALTSAIALHVDGKLPEAESAFRILLHDDGQSADLLHLLANNLIAQNRHQDAIEYLDRAIALRPGSAAIHHELGIIASALGQHNAAEQSFRRALGLQPDFVEALASYAALLTHLGRLDEAENNYVRALELRPDFAPAAYNFGRLLHAEGRVAEATVHYRRAFIASPGFVDAHSNYIYWLNFDSAISPRAVFNAHVEWAQVHAEPLRSLIPIHRNESNPDRLLRIGYVSPNFVAHAAAYFFESTVASHDPSKVQIFGYSDVVRGDDHTERIKRHCSYWRDCAQLDDTRLAALIQEDKIDILVDLSGHTRGNRLAVFARKPAPVQITWNGYANTTGMSAMDYRISDYLADPPGLTEHLHTETLLRMPEAYMVFSRPLASPTVGPLPAARSGTITFGSFNAISKITPVVVETWSRILKANLSSRLLIAAVPSQSARVRICGMFGECGIDPTRLTLHGPVQRPDFLALHHEADIALDPFPFNGTTTTCDSLWMGLPVITLAGASHVSRVGLSMLTNIGLPELIASSTDEYVTIATDLANHPNRLQEMRASLRQRMLASPVMDAPRFTKNLESAYRQVWHAWCMQRVAQPKTESSQPEGQSNLESG